MPRGPKPIFGKLVRLDTGNGETAWGADSSAISAYGGAMKFKLPFQLLKPFYRDGHWMPPPAHDGNGVFERPDDELPGIVRDFPSVEILSDDLGWFRMPDGTTGLSVEQQEFDADESGYFQAPVSLAPKILYLSGFSWIGSQRPSDPVGATSIGAESRAVRQLLKLFEGDPDRLLSKAKCLAALRKSEALGQRAFDRVWQKATEQSPDRRKPGSKGGRRQSNHDAD
jgi:hypothetical protein